MFSGLTDFHSVILIGVLWGLVVPACLEVQRVGYWDCSWSLPLIVFGIACHGTRPAHRILVWESSCDSFGLASEVFPASILGEKGAL